MSNASQFISRLGKLYRFIGLRCTSYLVFGVATGLAAFAIEIAFAYVLQDFLYALGINTAPAAVGWIPKLNLAQVLVLIFLIGLSRAAIQWLHFYLTQTSSEIFTYEQRSRLMDWAFRNTAINSGYITTFFTELITSSANFLSAVQAIFILSPSAILLFASLIYLAPTPTLIASLCLVIAALLMRGLNRRTAKASIEMSASYQNAASQMLRGVKNLLLLQIYGTSQKEEQEILASLRISRDKKILSYKLASTKFALPQVVGLASICVITLVVQQTQTLSPTTLISYFYLFVRFVQTVSEGMRSGSVLIFSRPHAERLAKWWADHSFDGVHRRHAREHAAIPAPFEQPVGWRLKNVSFTYPGATRPTISRLDLEILPRQSTVITGSSGAGKSTLLSLLLGGAEPQSGRISLIKEGQAGETNLVDCRQQLLESIGYVGPESFLIEGTIRENLIYGSRVQPNDQEIYTALEKAECQFVSNLPEKLDHRLTEQGEGLSAGQKQRLSLARALLRKPRVLILDEATANLDAETEARLTRTLAELKKEMTIVVVTHRLSLLEIADQKLKLESV